MISVDEARALIFDLVRPTRVETVPLREAAGRVLATDAVARRDQPPFDASSMDGYAVQTVEVEKDAMFRVIGEAAAGHRFEGRVGPGQAVRIFTGAPVPEGAGTVVIQEDVRRDGQLITITEPWDGSHNIRKQGNDFAVGSTVSAPKLLRPQDAALLAAMNIDRVEVFRRPVVALISTGDELVFPGANPGPDQIVASNTFGLDALLRAEGADVRILPIAQDNEASIETVLVMAAEGGGRRSADLVVTIGGASVGDHDLVGQVAASMGLDRAFYKIAMRPGKPLMAGRLGDAAMVGLPGNPVSAMVCGRIFLVPMVHILTGRGAAAPGLRPARLGESVGQNGPREHYMRAVVEDGTITAFGNQDSAVLTLLAQANALLMRPPHDPAREVGEEVLYLPF
ncbi:molybdopterin molybdotransferase MoeA [Chachezhania sediminis]|uniref:molybdopterin molybdotransferase MoeA n=1 Tax=Chachezhania sediminis TaxID=2599291 RepID=UPI00131B3928|nr:gephyrin-like molybdotransferase Glp [Chachezhania sediminis]